MPSELRRPRRRLAWVAAGLAALFLVLVLVRKPLAAAAITSSLEMAGAGDVSLRVAEASPWGVLVENLGFKVRTQRFDAAQVRIERRSWWSPSLGVVRVSGARVPVTVDGSDTNPWAWSTYAGGSAPAGGGGIGALPADELSIDGVLVVKAASQADQEITVSFEAKLGDDQHWQAKADLRGPGIALSGQGKFQLPVQQVQFGVTVTELDLGRWEGFIQSLVTLPGGRWELSGRLEGNATGTYEEDKVTATGRVGLRDGRFRSTDRGVLAEGVTADFKLSDVERLRSEPGTIRVRSLQAGGVEFRNVDLEVALAGPEKFSVSRATLEAFGGKLATEPFVFVPRRNELDFTLLADGIVVEQVLTLAKDLPARATGLVDGRVPVRIDASGLRFGTGWLELKRGTAAEVQFNASGLLTRGVAVSNPTYSTLKRIESGLLRLRLSELRLDLRPPNQPPGRSATLKIAGEPVDKDVKAPVNLNLNVNGPIEQLLNLGLDGRVNFGGKK
jgi:hypothetical protein